MKLNFERRTKVSASGHPFSKRHKALSDIGYRFWRCLLRSVGEFPHKVISTRIYDYGFQGQGENNYEGNITPLAGEFNEDYVSLQLLEHVDGIDYERSEFRPRLNPNRPPYITNLVLKEPIDGFPPIFRLKSEGGEEVYLFVSPTAKEALEEAGIKGLDFLPKKGTRAQEASTAR